MYIDTSYENETYEIFKIVANDLNNTLFVLSKSLIETNKNINLDYSYYDGGLFLDFNKDMEIDLEYFTKNIETRKDGTCFVEIYDNNDNIINIEVDKNIKPILENTIKTLEELYSKHKGYSINPTLDRDIKLDKIQDKTISIKDLTKDFKDKVETLEYNSYVKLSLYIKTQLLSLINGFEKNDKVNNFSFSFVDGIIYIDFLLKDGEELSYEVEHLYSNIEGNKILIEDEKNITIELSSGFDHTEFKNMLVTLKELQQTEKSSINHVFENNVIPSSKVAKQTFDIIK